ncbi:GNAT family N-acetyltransferase [Paracidobacterium acidisoli]|uniref:N-acetyltransferase n=1 Tax=Paracidobacterium acidisoli TaxID=2303751 RepID=A0A372IMZ6_9BACT|nr:GNAT family N-acetyltransferase [Paracidobacterium acidisoli]MBT9331741.1 GNAT family N-acetyltransferase [Paracidobacterium acidisoli]
MTDSFATRFALPSDAALISRHRRLMFADAGLGTSSDLARMEQSHERWVAQRIQDGAYIGWLIEDRSLERERPAVAASAGMLLLDWPPHPLDPEGSQRAYLLNVFVEPEYRRQRLGHSLIQLALAEAQRRGIRVTALHATEKGRYLYEILGFKTTNEMHFHAPEV